MNKIIIQAWLLLIFFSGCTYPLQTSTIITDANSYQKQLATLTRWELEGKIGVRHANQSDSAAVQWKQDKDHFDIFLSGPLGAGATRLMGTPKQLTIQNGQEEITNANDPEHLIEKQLGWTLPMAKIPQWILGCSDNKNARFNTDHTLAGFSENTWQVDYLAYQTVDRWLLPEKIILTHEDMRVTIVIKQWSLH